MITGITLFVVVYIYIFQLEFQSTKQCFISHLKSSSATLLAYPSQDI